MEIALVSDTHIPSREQHIPDPFCERIQQADHVVHAGDFDSKGALADLQEMAPELTAVAGNMDPQIGLPRVATVEFEGCEFVVTHGTGSKRGYEQRVADIVREHAATDDAVGIAGHTHEVLDTVHDGVHLLNPGSATGARPAAQTTMMTLTVADGDVDATLYEL